MANMALGGGGRWDAWVASHGGGAEGEESARKHCISKYGAEACDKMHHQGTSAAPYAKSQQKAKSGKGKMMSFQQWMSSH